MPGTYIAIEHFTEWLAAGRHDFANDTYKIVLLAAANTPTAATDESYDDLTIAVDQTHLDDDTLVITSATQIDGTVSIAVNDFAILADGGSVGPFRHICVFCDTPALDVDKGLVCYYSLGADLTLSDGESLSMQFTDNTLLTIGACPP